jgi:uncharacterized membrane protein YtjA (UPF0391 family)
MLRWSFLFLAIAIVAAVIGFTTVAGDAYLGARLLFFVFVVLFVVSLLLSGTRTPRELT